MRGFSITLILKQNGFLLENIKVNGSRSSEEKFLDQNAWVVRDDTLR